MHNDELRRIALTIANLVEKWQLNDMEKLSILGFDIKNIPQEMTQEQQQRLSLILNIHDELRQLFKNPNNLYGFMTMKNHNSSYNGRRPVDLAKNLDGLHSVYAAISQIGA
jgi:hypothetical protein